MKYLMLVPVFFLTLNQQAISLPEENPPNHLFWETNIEKAKALASENDLNILMVFSGSDWCKPCMKLKKDILLSNEFQKYAINKLVILDLDFPIRKKNQLSKAQTKNNEALAAKYNASGAFPKIVLLKKDETILGEPEFRGQSPIAFAKELDEMMSKNPKS